MDSIWIITNMQNIILQMFKNHRIIIGNTTFCVNFAAGHIIVNYTIS